jgi:hypothetical protein
MASKKYYPNNWKSIKDLPDDLFEPTDYELIIDNLVTGWELNSSVDTILRATNIHTKQVQEYTYIRPCNARSRLKKLCAESCYEIVVMRSDEMFHIYPSSKDSEDNADTH